MSTPLWQDAFNGKDADATLQAWRAADPRQLARVECAAAGDVEALAQLVAQEQAAVFRVCVRIIHDQDEAEDVTSDVFVKLYCRPELLRQSFGKPFHHWLLRVATNAAHDALRKRRRHWRILLARWIPRFREPAPDWGAEALYRLEQLERSAPLHAALAQLTHKQYCALVWHVVDNMDDAEIGASLGISADWCGTGAKRPDENCGKVLGTDELAGGERVPAPVGHRDGGGKR